MRMLAVLLLFVSTSLAAPIPADAKAKAERERLTKFWVDATQLNNRQFERNVACLQLIKEPGVVAFLAERCQPVGCTKVEYEGWVKDLSSDDELVRAKATQAVKDQYGCRHMALGEMIRQCDGPTAKTALLQAMGLDRYVKPGDEITFTLKPGEGSVTLELGIVNKARRSMGNLTAVIRDDELQDPTYRRTAVESWMAACLLRVIGTEPALAVLRKAAGGDASAALTKRAKFLLDGKPTSTTWENYGKLWPQEQDPLDPMKNSNMARPIAFLSFTTDKAAVKDIVGSVKPYTVTREQQLAAWKDLSSEDAGKWQEAYRQFAEYSPFCTLTFEEIIEGLKHAERFKRFVAATQQLPIDKFDDTFQPTNMTKGTEIDIRVKHGKEQYRYQIMPNVGDHGPIQLQREAIVMLEHHATPEAVAHLKKLASAAPELPQTKDAADALARLKAK